MSEYITPKSLEEALARAGIEYEPHPEELDTNWQIVDVDLNTETFDLLGEGGTLTPRQQLDEIFGRTGYVATRPVTDPGEYFAHTNFDVYADTVEADRRNNIFEYIKTVFGSCPMVTVRKSNIGLDGVWRPSANPVSDWEEAKEHIEQKPHREYSVVPLYGTPDKPVVFRVEVWEYVGDDMNREPVVRKTPTGKTLWLAGGTDIDK